MNREILKKPVSASIVDISSSPTVSSSDPTIGNVL